MTKWLSWRGTFMIPVIFLVAIVAFAGDRLSRRLDPVSAENTPRSMSVGEVTPVIGAHDLAPRSAGSVCSAQVGERRHPDSLEAVILSPRPDQLIRERRDFPVSYSIAETGGAQEPTAHHWVSVATLTSGNRLDVHFPKVLLKSRGVVRVFDGGQNPLPDPQPMCLLILRVTDSRSNAFAAWLAAGPPFQGLPVDPAEIVEAVPVYFR